MTSENNMNRKIEKSNNQQINTFLRWINAIIKEKGKAIENLRNDLCDGVVLIALIEVLSGKCLSNYHKQPTQQKQKIENVSLVIQFLELENIEIIVDIGK